MDVDKLLKALDNDNNEDIIDTTTATLKSEVCDVLTELELEEETRKDLCHKLRDYRHVEDISKLASGAYIRWICMKNPDEIHLTNGALLCDIRFGDEGISLICKGFRNRHFQVKFDECIIFQRLSEQEQVLLSALDYLSK